MPRGRPVALETPRLILRSLTPADASERWAVWANDPEVMDTFNRPARGMTVSDLAVAVTRYDNDTRFGIGVFDKANGLHVGIFFIGLSKRDGLAQFSLLIGDRDYWGRNIVNEARAALLDYFFTERGVEKAYGTPFARNFPAVFNYKAQGWRLEGILVKHRYRASDGQRVDMCHFGMLREDWLARKAPEKVTA